MPESKIFHITHESEVPSARGRGFYLPKGFETEGFIHCSTSNQIVATANRIFAGQSGLCVLEIEVSKVQHEIRYENLEGGEELFPHIYGPLHFDAVTRVHDFPCDDRGRFHFTATP